MAVELIVHTFRLGDVDDVEIYAAQPMWEWQQTECGKWVMDNSINSYWCRNVDHTTYGYRFNIVATFTDQDATWFKLKYGDANH